MSAGFKVYMHFSSFSLREQLSMGQRRRALRAAGTKLATRLRKRIKASGRFRVSGQMINSIKFKLYSRIATGTIRARGLRRDSDTHKNRRPMQNFAIAAFHAAKGHDVLAVSDADEQFMKDEIEAQIAKMLAKM